MTRGGESRGADRHGSISAHARQFTDLPRIFIDVPDRNLRRAERWIESLDKDRAIACSGRMTGADRICRANARGDFA